MRVEDAVQALASDPNVEYVSPNYYRYLDVFPSDPQGGALWGLHNTGQTGGTPDADIDAPEGWDITQGSEEVVIAVIDSGAQLDHEDLGDNIWVNPKEDLNGNGTVDPSDLNGIDDDANGFVDDLVGWDFSDNDNNPSPVGGACQGHGTHTAGTIGAVGDNGVGISGVNWTTKLMILKAFRTQLRFFCSASDADLIQAIEYTTMMGVKVSSNSWGGGGFNPAMQDAIRASNSVFLAAAGNGGFDGNGDDNDSSPSYPASYDLSNIVAVAATDHNDDKAGFSNFGQVSVDLGAPGVSILSTLPGDSYGSFSGTSMATPHVAGAAGLLLAQDPSYTVNEVVDRLTRGVDPIPALAGRTTTGGRLNAFNSLSLPLASQTGVTIDLDIVGPDTLQRGGTLNLSITVQNHTAGPVPIRGILYVKIPGGMTVDLEGPIFKDFPANQTKIIPFSAIVSNNAPFGTYHVFGQVLNPDSLDEDVVEVSVVP